MSDQFALTGSPALIRTSAGRWSGFAQTAAQAAADLRALTTDQFVGDEADLYREQLIDTLPPNLDTVDRAWSHIAAALTTYADVLESCQTRLNSLAADHAEQSTQVAGADSALADARTADHRHTLDRQAATDDLQPGQTLPPDTYRPQTTDAQTALANAQAARQATIDAAAGIRTEHDTAVTTCVNAINEAKDWRFEDPPGWFESLVSSVGDWIAEHADILTAISSVLKTISGIAGVLAMIPILAPIAGPIAFATGAGALVIDGAVMLATGEGDLLTFGMEALALIPGVRAAKVAMTADVAVVGYQVATGQATPADLAMVVGLGALGSRSPSSGRPATTASRAPGSDVRAAPPHVRIDTPGDIRYSQQSVSFRKTRPDGSGGTTTYTYDDIASSMSRDGWTGPPVDVVRMQDGRLTSLDNTRVRAATETGTPVHANIRPHEEVLSEGDVGRFTRPDVEQVPSTWGEAVEVRVAGQSRRFSTDFPLGSPELPRVTGRPAE